ncbi:hypothetical protein C0Q70_14327 [Pomacea canaliculata]|uniref:Uncharacterized protein n=1 Tax=Pomacea canaliculata TaxID=400727 RepID=A0A2T7NZR1_POMCA|nr:hypothetical protein C0Q70_14327 [Pomacea canaliculata]
MIQPTQQNYLSVDRPDFRCACPPYRGYVTRMSRMPSSGPPQSKKEKQKIDSGDKARTTPVTSSTPLRKVRAGAVVGPANSPRGITSKAN